MKKPARDAGAVNAKIKASVQDTRQGTVNAKITSPRGHGDTGTRGQGDGSVVSFLLTKRIEPSMM